MTRNDESIKGPGEINPHRVVIGIDPASGEKGSYVFAPGVPDPNPGKPNSDGIDRPMTPEELRELLPSQVAQVECGKKPFGTNSCLVCWDAPLSGLQKPDAINVEKTNGDERAESLTTRPIERTDKTASDDVQRRRIVDASKEPGVSVLGFSGLSHWVISRNVLGLPRVGRFDAAFDQLPLFPIFSEEELPKHQWAVTEVHPTLAVYLWLHDPANDTETSWRQYKGNGKEADVPSAVKAMWKTLCDRFLKNRGRQLSPPETEDAFDARVAWLLGHLWLQGDAVELVGTEQDGTFLLPKQVATSSRSR